MAASGVGSSGFPPSPEHCSFAGRQGNCLLIAEVPDGAWGRGSAGQNGSVGRAARRGSPPPVVSAARPGRQQKQRRPLPLSIASPEGSALRPRGARSAQQVVPEVPWLASQRDAEPWSATGLVDHVERPAGKRREGARYDAPPPPRTKSILLPASRAKQLGGKEWKSLAPVLLSGKAILSRNPTIYQTDTLPCCQENNLLSAAAPGGGGTIRVKVACQPPAPEALSWAGG